MLRLSPSIAMFLIATSLSGCTDKQSRDVSEYVARAAAYEREGEPQKARVELENAFRIAPADPKLNLALARIEDAAGNLQEAVPHYLRAATPDARLRDAQIRLIEILIDAGRFQDAKGRINLMLGSFPDDNDALALRADVEARENEKGPARLDANTVLQKSPTQPRALAVLARLDLYARDPQAALNRLSIGLANQPNDIRLLQMRAAALVFAGKYKEAADAWKTLVQIKPKDVLARKALADLQSQTGNLDEAISGFVSAAAAAPDSDGMQLGLARFLAAHGKQADAVALLQRLIKDNPSVNVYDLALADYYQNVDQLTQARQVLAAARSRLGNAPAGRDILTGLAKIDAQSGHPDLARADLDAVLVADPGNTAALLFKADLDQSDGRSQDAVTGLLAVLRGDPVNQVAYERLATLYAQLGKTKLAADAMRRSIAAGAPSDTAAQLRLAGFLQVAGDAAGSRQILQGLVAAHPDDPQVWVATGQLAIARKDWPSVSFALTKLQQISGMDAAAGRLQGELQAAKGDNAAAMVSFQTALDSLHDLDAGLVGLYALAAAGANRASDAAAVLAKRAPSLGPASQAVIWPAVMTLSADAGDEPGAVDAFDHAKALTPSDSDLYRAMARILAAKGDSEGAHHILRDGIAAGASKPSLMMAMGDLEYAKAPKIAMDHYKEALDDNPFNVIAANNYGSLLADFAPGDTEALTQARQRLNGEETSENPAILDTIAWLDYRLARFDEAKALLTRANASTSANPQRRFHLAAVLLALGEKSAGITLLETVKGQQFPGSAEVSAIAPS